MAMKGKGDSGKAAQAFYEKQPSSKVGEFSRADAQVADLNKPSSSDMPEPFSGRKRPAR